MPIDVFVGGWSFEKLLQLPEDLAVLLVGLQAGKKYPSPYLFEARGETEGGEEGGLGGDMEVAWSFTYTYPLSIKVSFTAPMLRRNGIYLIGDFAIQCAKDYAAIYATTRELTEEERRPSQLVNAQFPTRGAPANPYGIWGHAMSDLALESMHFDVPARAVTFGIGS